jgi:hypothetical protein
MVSDTLFDAVAGLDHYLNEPTFADTYTGELRERIIKIRNEAATLQGYLDTSPTTLELPLNDAFHIEGRQVHFFVTLEMKEIPEDTTRIKRELHEAIDQRLENMDPQIERVHSIKQVKTMSEVVDSLLGR